MIYLVAGYAGAGKGVASNYLLNALPKAQEISFARPIKRWAIDHFGLKMNECFNSADEARRAGYAVTSEEEIAPWEKSEISRWVLQSIGECAREEFNPNFWSIMACEEITREDDDPMEEGNYIISDWRYPNEKEVVEATFGKDVVQTIRVVRSDRKPIEAGSQHHSETSLSDDMEYNIVFHNDKTVEDLEGKIRQWLLNIKALTQVASATKI